MPTCDCCGEQVQLLTVVDNADLDPWQVCAQCHYGQLDEDDLEACDVA